MTDTCLEVCGLIKRFGGIIALSDFSCVSRHGEILGVIGPNGAGKTTLFNVVSSLLEPDAGIVSFHGMRLSRLAPYQIAQLGIARTFQKLRLIEQTSVMDNVLLAFGNQPGERLRDLFFRSKATRACEDENRSTAESLLARVGLDDKIGISAGALSYGQQKLLTLVCCLARGPDLLLLDEPIAGIDPEMAGRIQSLIKELRDEGKSLIMIEHNLDAVTRLCDRVIFMDAGRKVSEGTPEEVRNDPKVIAAYLD